MALSSANPSIYGAHFAVRSLLQNVTRKKIPPNSGGSWITTILILGITITSGVCLLTFGLSRPIFAKEASLEFQKQLQEQALLQQEMEESARWEAALAKKYAKYQINRPTAGIAHVKIVKYVDGKPIKVNVVEINPIINKNLVIKPEVAGTTLARRAQISTMATRNSGIVAVNAGYFKPETGVPLGTLMIDGKMLTGPIYNRVAMGITQSGPTTTFTMSRTAPIAEVKNKNFTLSADNLNQPRMLSTYTLVYTPDWGEFSPPPPKYGSVVAIENGKMQAISSTSALKIPKDGFVVSAPSDAIQKLITEKNLKLEISLPEDFTNAQHIISGGPYLVKDGTVFVDVQAQKLNAIDGKNPRTAVGYTKEGVLIMVTVDGREQQSVGMTLSELAYMMKSLGCENAMNLDGGGSSVMYVNGRITNSPPQTGGIPISNALVVSEKTGTLVAGSNLSSQ